MSKLRDEKAWRTIADANQSLLETAVALMDEFNQNRQGYELFYRRHGQELSGFPGVRTYIISAARAFEAQAATAGEPGVDYEWIDAISEFAGMIQSQARARKTLPTFQELGELARLSIEVCK